MLEIGVLAKKENVDHETGLGHSWNRDTLSDRHGIVSVDCIFREMVSEKGITVVIISRYIGNTKTLYPDHSVDTAFHFLLLFFKCFTVFYCYSSRTHVRLGA